MTTAQITRYSSSSENCIRYMDTISVFQLPHLEFALNHHGEPDTALFDFTSMFAAGFASHVAEKHQKQVRTISGKSILYPVCVAAAVRPGRGRAARALLAHRHWHREAGGIFCRKFARKIGRK